MSAKSKKLKDTLKELQSNSDVDGCALVSDRGQVMSSALAADVDEKAVGAMAAALVSIGSRVGTALGSGAPKSIVIEGNGCTIILRKIRDTALIGTAPVDAKLGLIDFEMSKTAQTIEEIL
ncbi:MAG: roadblock/LC7 domain-containing protein [Candidatus Thorarchaeota archaeon]